MPWESWSPQTRPSPGWRRGSGLTGSSQCCNTTNEEGLSLNEVKDKYSDVVLVWFIILLFCRFGRN